MNKRALMKRTKAAVDDEDAQKRLQHAKSLECQGQIFRSCEEKAANIWAIAVQNLPPNHLKFSLNAAHDTLPHNANLARWRKNEGLSNACKLCGGRQTLLHVLNNFPRALSLRRYNERHNEVLEVITSFFEDNLPPEYNLLADLPRFQPYVFPPSITVTDEWPD